jgi:hypothetical protein
MLKFSRGTFAILLMVVVAFGLSTFAAWYRYQAGDAALRYWGKDAALRIRSAPKVKLMMIEQDATASKPIEIHDTTYQITQVIDISSARGLIHARHALLEDASLDELAVPPSPAPDWDRVIEFTAVDGETTAIAIDLETGWMIRPGTKHFLKLKESKHSKLEQPVPGLVSYLKKFTVEPKSKP